MRSLDKKSIKILGIPYNPICPNCKHLKSLHHIRLENRNKMVCFGNAFSGKSCDCKYSFVILDIERQQGIRIS